MTPTKAALEALESIRETIDNSQRVIGNGDGYFCIALKDATKLNEQINTIKQALTANTWRDIKDAPRDGTRILIWDKNFGASRVMFWAHGEEEDGDCWFIDASHGPYAFKALPEISRNGNLTKWKPLDKPEQPS